MAYILQQIGSQTNISTNAYTVDNISDMNALNVNAIVMGSTCYVVNESETYILNSNKEWIKKLIPTNQEQVLDPKSVYQNTRPNDWLTMPTPSENEIYMLVHIPENVSTLLAFRVNCLGSYTVEYGTVEDGEFIAVSDFTQTIAANTKFEDELYASEWNDLTENGMKQVMVKISSDLIIGWYGQPNSKHTTGYAVQNIVEIAAQLPYCTSFAVGNTTERYACESLKYFALYGTNSISNADNMFYNCFSLISILEFNTSNVTSMDSMCYNCYCLRALPNFDTSNVTDMRYMFFSCAALPSIPTFNTSKVTNFNGTFGHCYSLNNIPELDWSAVVTASATFAECRTLTEVPTIHLSNANDISRMFFRCYSLKKIELSAQGATILSETFQNCNNLETVALYLDSAEKMDNMFSNCHSLQTAFFSNTSTVEETENIFANCPSLKEVSVINIENMTQAVSLANCYALNSITFDAGAQCEGIDINLSYCSLGYDALVRMFNSLPTITTSHTITLTGNPGAEDLGDTEKAIATNKNWTLIL